jgi:hypothetical protein
MGLMIFAELLKVYVTGSPKLPTDFPDKKSPHRGSRKIPSLIKSAIFADANLRQYTKSRKIQKKMTPLSPPLASRCYVGRSAEALPACMRIKASVLAFFKIVPGLAVSWRLRSVCGRWVYLEFFSHE